MTHISDKWRGVLIRSAAEVAIVVLGVTIALWADGWVSDRHDRAQERARLIALQDNVLVTLERLNAARQNSVGAADALRILSSVQQGEQVDAQSLDALRYGLTYGPNFVPELNVYDDLKNSGELALLTNPDLRRALATMESRLDLVKISQDDLTAVMQLTFDPYLISRMDLRSLYGPYLGMQDVGDAAEANLKESSSREFQNLVLFKLDLIMEVDETLRHAEDVLLEVQEILQSQIE